MKYTEINIVMEHSEDFDTFYDKFIDLVESAGWTFGGGMTQVDSDGNQINNGEKHDSDS